uniref:Protein kinase domain-containing protein n=1 Tax=Parascaris univalens TaxID=6257 RepID=A0A915A1N1_PARUN
VLTCTYEFVTFLRQQGIYFRRTRSGIGGGSDERTNAELRPGPMPSETTSAAPLSASPASSTPAVEWVRGSVFHNWSTIYFEGISSGKSRDFAFTAGKGTPTEAFGRCSSANALCPHIPPY